MKNKITFFTLLLIPTLVFAQKFTGIITDAETKERLSYVALGIVGRPAGTISDFEGSYSFSIDPKFDSDSIRVSLIGYRPLTFKVSVFKKMHEQGSLKLTLIKASIQLEEVIVKVDHVKRKKLGHNFTNPHVILGLKTDAIGSEVAGYIYMKPRTAIIENIGINIARNDFDSVLLRINFYDVKNGLPDRIISSKAVYYLLKGKTGNIRMNVRDYNIVVKKDFYISVQWISKEPSKILIFCAGFRGAHAIRNSSEDTWEKINSFGLGINCGIVYQ